MDSRGCITITASLSCFLVVCCSCSKTPDFPPEYSSKLDKDTLTAVCEWMMSSQNALWEDSVHRRLFVGDGEPVQILNEALSQNSVFVKTFSIDDNLIAIFDAYQQQIAMFDNTGEMHWLFGSEGSGPEHYSANIEGILNQYGLTIRDSSLSKLDLVRLNGELRVSLTISGVQTGLALPDGKVCVISSWDSANGIVSIFDSTGVLESSFGDDSEMYELPSMPYYRFCVFSEHDRLVAFASYKHTFICIADLDAETTQFYSREYPFQSPTLERLSTADGATAGLRVFPNINSVFIGPDNTINVQVLVPNRNGHFSTALADYDRDYTVVDRFNWNGEYLDTFLVPMPRIGSLTYNNGFFYARSYDDDLIYRFPVYRFESL